MEDTYKYYVGKYIEKKTNLVKPFLAVLDRNGIFNNINNLNVYIYPYNVIEVKDNIIFRSKYEHLKQSKDERYIFVLKDQDIQFKLQDFIKRAEEGKVIETNIKDILDIVEDDLEWHVRINQYNTLDIQKIFNELMHYRKYFNKKSIDAEEVDRIFLSALYELNALSIEGFVDCYIYYKSVIDLYGEINKKEYNTDAKKLLCKVFSDKEGLLLSSAIKLNIFNEFEKLMWICYILNSFKKLNLDNVKTIMGKDYEKVKPFEKTINDLVEYVKIIEKKDKKLFVDMKDKYEKCLLDDGLDLYTIQENHVSFLKENLNSYICIVDSIRKILKGFNIEGLKKVFRYNIDNLKEVSKILNGIQYSTDNTNYIKSYYNDFMSLITNVEALEKNTELVSEINSFSEWNDFYTEKLSWMQYLLSKLRYEDKDEIIEHSRYNTLDKRINVILNKYRVKFSRFIVDNYKQWMSTEYGPSRPIMNKDIEKIIDFKDKKIFIIVFDGMRYDAWDKVVYKYFYETLLKRETMLKTSFALLPTITSVSRESIYKNILSKYKGDVTYTTKSEAFNKQNDIEEKLIQDKKINIVIYNMFDKDGHKASEDFYLFYDKQEKVFEISIKNLIKNIPDDATIVITSDHGLMRLDDYVNVKDVDGITTVKSRYLDTEKNAMVIDGINYENYILSYTNKGYFASGGEKDLYSHGGCSLEEVIVPFIYARPKTMQQNSMLSYSVTKTIDKNNETIIMYDNRRITLPIKISEKEQLFLCSLYKLKSLNTRDVEKIFLKQFGSAGMIDGMLRRFIRKMQAAGIDIIDTTTAGEFIVYKLNSDNLFGGDFID